MRSTIPTAKKRCVHYIINIELHENQADTIKKSWPCGLSFVLDMVKCTLCDSGVYVHVCIIGLCGWCA